MRTYTAGQDDGGPASPDTREWVFGLLETPRYRQRMEQLEQLELRRRSGCEPCLRSLVVDEWTPETLHHVGWCDSCRAATIALGMHAPAAAGSGWVRRRAGWLAVAAFAVVAVPLVASQVIGDHGSAGVRGGSAVAIAGSTTGTPGTPGTTTPTPGTTTPPPSTTPSTPVTPVPRSKPASAVGHARGQKALPLTT